MDEGIRTVANRDTAVGLPDEPEPRHREADHRIANSFQISATILNRAKRDITDAAQARAALQQASARLQATARIHRMLSRSLQEGPVEMSDLLAALAADLSESLDIAIDVQAEGVTLPCAVAMDVGVIVAEMAINTAKHGFRDGTAPSLAVDADRNGLGDVRLRVCDDGPGLPDGFDPRASDGLGMSLVVSTVERLGGSIEIGPAMVDFPGAQFEIVLPSSGLGPA